MKNMTSQADQSRADLSARICEDNMKKFTPLFLSALLFTSCSAAESNNSAAPTAFESESLRPECAYSYAPLNYEDPVGMWLPYMLYEDILAGKTADEFRAAIAEKLTAAQSEGVNTVYVHVRPNGDAYYDSDIFPRGAFCGSSFDPFAIILDEAHRLGISVHAWINPLRLQTVQQMNELPQEFTTKQWYDSQNGRIKQVGERLWLDPSYEETRGLIAEGVREIVQKYEVDGVHIDDYFYPTTEPSFDADEFAASGSDDLSAWRIGNINSLVRLLHDTVKECDSRLLFGISPQGNIESDYSSQYADVRLWAASGDYCDYIVPQLYFGFRNESCPFMETLAEWESLTGDEVKLVIGLAPYKVGKADKWAGAGGESEWTDDPDVIAKQIAAVLSSTADGYALYY